MSQFKTSVLPAALLACVACIGCEFAGFFPPIGIPATTSIIHAGGDKIVIVGDASVMDLDTLGYRRLDVGSGTSQPLAIPNQIHDFRSDGRSLAWAISHYHDGPESPGIYWLDLETGRLDTYFDDTTQTEYGFIDHVEEIFGDMLVLTVYDEDARLLLFDRRDQSMLWIPADGPSSAWLLHGRELIGFRRLPEDQPYTFLYQLVASDLDTGEIRIITDAPGYDAYFWRSGDRLTDRIAWSESIFDDDYSTPARYVIRSYDAATDSLSILYDESPDNHASVVAYGYGSAGVVVGRSEPSGMFDVITRYFVLRPDGSQVPFHESRFGLLSFSAPEIMPFLAGERVIWTDPRSFRLNYYDLSTGTRGAY